MTAPQTLPLPRIPAHSQPHEHAWLIESRHRTSEGTLLYVRCVDCGNRRLDSQTHPHRPPSALSREIGEPRRD
ncbi:hypothetical protein [Microbacterium oxydans]|uniref:Uncharacterized protein n=1 Tax=Microbacterium oxydans TaxID=82380 RepID=A0A0F0L6A5_9MICO|nr:hypothetical protein [Microbacterium oxydans]KJL28673.1 hypothetical protein RS83_02149 [Microbacterium oxydans]